MSASPTFPTTAPIDSPARVAEIWGRELHTAGCPACKQVFLVAPAQANRLCPNCAQAPLAPQPALLRCEPPELLIEPAVPHVSLAQVFGEFVRGVWLHTPDFTAESLRQRAVLVFWPMWLVDADIAGNWQAETGFDYQVKSSQEHYQGGSWQTTERVETRIRWEPRVGQVRRHYDNAAVPALTEHSALAGLVGEYQPGASKPYETEKIGPALVRLPDQHPENAWPLAKSRLDQTAAGECAQAAGAQHIRSFAFQAQYDALHWSQLLLPVYASYYTDDDGRRHPVFVNAQTGKAGGLRLASQKQGLLWAGIIGGAAAAMLLLGLLIVALGALFPPIAFVGVFMAVVAVVIGLAAIAPLAWPWQWNRQQRAQRVTPHTPNY